MSLPHVDDCFYCTTPNVSVIDPMQEDRNITDPRLPKPTQIIHHHILQTAIQEMQNAFAFLNEGETVSGVDEDFKRLSVSTSAESASKRSTCNTLLLSTTSTTGTESPCNSFLSTTGTSSKHNESPFKVGYCPLITSSEACTSSPLPQSHRNLIKKHTVDDFEHPPNAIKAIVPVYKPVYSYDIVQSFTSSSSKKPVQNLRSLRSSSESDPKNRTGNQSNTTWGDKISFPSPHPTTNNNNYNISNEANIRSQLNFSRAVKLHEGNGNQRRELLNEEDCDNVILTHLMDKCHLTMDKAVADQQQSHQQHQSHQQQHQSHQQQHQSHQQQHQSHHQQHQSHQQQHQSHHQQQQQQQQSYHKKPPPQCRHHHHRPSSSSARFKPYS